MIVLRCVAIALFCGAAFAAAAQQLPPPAGEVVLVVSGRIGAASGDGEVRFDRSLLASLPQHSFSTTTIWTAGTHRYTGVLLKDLLAAVKAEGTTLTAIALNEYESSFPIAEVVEDAPLVAYLTDGEPMSVRDKGPLWLIYPYDANPAYRAELIYSRSVWQLVRIEISE